MIIQPEKFWSHYLENFHPTTSIRDEWDEDQVYLWEDFEACGRTGIYSTNAGYKELSLFHEITLDPDYDYATLKIIFSAENHDIDIMCAEDLQYWPKDLYPQTRARVLEEVRQVKVFEDLQVERFGRVWKVLGFRPSYDIDQAQYLCAVLGGRHQMRDTRTFEVHFDTWYMVLCVDEKLPGVFIFKDPKTVLEWRQHQKTVREIADKLELYERIKSDYIPKGVKS